MEKLIKTRKKKIYIYIYISLSFLLKFCKLKVLILIFIQKKYVTFHGLLVNFYAKFDSSARIIIVMSVLY